MKYLRRGDTFVVWKQDRLGRDLENIALKCLEKEVDRRYASAHEVAEDLYNYCEGRPVGARPISRFARGMRWCKRRGSWHRFCRVAHDLYGLTFNTESIS